jgi:hypothetical protein
MMLTYRYRVLPTKRQHRALEGILEGCGSSTTPRSKSVSTPIVSRALRERISISSKP